MPLWQKLASYWVATNPEIAESQVAKSNLPLAKAIADKIRAVLVDEEQGLGLKLNTGKDLPSTGVQQQDEKGFSFPLYPDDLAKAKNIGFIQVNGQYSEAMPESGEANKGKSITVNMEVCYYFKKPKLPGGGKCMFNTPAGQIDITFDDGGNPEIVDSGQVVDVADAIENLTNQIIDSPPEGSQSTAAPDPHEAEIKREQAERARRVQKQEVQQSGDKETHGTIEDFVQYMEDQGETTFGPGDRQKLLNNLYRTPRDRAFQSDAVTKAVENYGLKFDPKKKTVASGPFEVAAELRRIAAKLDASESPSMTLLLQDLHRVIDSL